MKFSSSQADVYVPRGGDAGAALARVTHLCVAAHQDDIEIMAFAGIADCIGRADRAFGGVVVTNGAGSPRAGAYARMSDGRMQQARRAEQRRAAELGGYAIQIQLAHPSAVVKRRGRAGAGGGVMSDLRQIFSACRPAVVYLHNPADKHDTHVAVALRCIEAMRALPAARRPGRVLGCEVWRGLDWLADSDARKVALDSGREPELAARLLGAFDSQLAGGRGKRYDLAAPGRRAANATFHESHAADKLAGITWAMDLTPLIQDGAPDVEKFVADAIAQFQSDVVGRIARLGVGA